jgi:phenylpropionate dioxygenase-like ring-hydroxylating dioxygenase large terminal subunit
MGQLFRRYWLPALLSEELPKPDCPPVRVRLLGEDLLAFRDSRGRVGLLGEYCSHRRASLFYGRNEDCGLRCVYHGWKYDVEGNLLETPAEPPESRLKERVRHTSYPCREAGGAVFAYLGPREKEPLFPSYEWLTISREHLGVTKFFLECNYLQALEGDCDTSHPGYLHRGNFGRGLEQPEEPPTRYEVERTWFGLRVAMIESREPDQSDVSTWTFAMPCIGSVPIGKVINGKLDGFLSVSQVPADDYGTWRYNFRFKRSEPWFPEELARDRGQVNPDFTFVANRRNGYLLDRERQRTSSYTGVAGTATQDSVMTDSMGPIVDRAQEVLGVHDTYIVALRSYLLQKVKDFQAGGEPPGLAFDSSRNDFSGTRCTLMRVGAGESWREVEARLYG